MNKIPSRIILAITFSVVALLIVWSIHTIRNPPDRNIWEILPIRPDGVQCYKWLATQAIVCNE